MTNDKFDRELNTLYQQRKSHITAPNITLSDVSKPSQRTPFQLFVILLTGGCASFAIMAFISHLSSMPNSTAPLTSSHVEVDIKDEVVYEEEKTTVVVKPPLPPQPTSQQPVTQEELAPEPVAPTKPITPEKVALLPSNDTGLPSINVPVLDIKPILKVLPKYPRNVTIMKGSSIKLRYTITVDGRVENPIVIKSNLVKSLEKSTKKALLQWRYKPNTDYPIQSEIIFEFEPINH
ncbi:energy transducer TonB [Litorilituus lipolyticus]|uniref:TonB C-terminal domain-containing protein n=1 Tax=Litorilituus lipolyticus TaxID=2491017 RepID=A0A502KVV4_9GAMM|nr:energy transducer TonB [Litorilituus lipolyticus]TPH15576.1 hypothetical protein EPA86_08320 [Litorilituus lipolyticus]